MSRRRRGRGRGGVGKGDGSNDLIMKGISCVTKTQASSIYCFDMASWDIFMRVVYSSEPYHSILCRCFVHIRLACRFSDMVLLHVYKWLLCYCWRECFAIWNTDVANKSGSVLYSFSCLLTRNATLGDANFCPVLCCFGQPPILELTTSAL